MGGNQKLGALVGPVFVLGAVLFAWPNTKARLDFADAPHVRATVLSAEYVKGAAAEVTLAVPEPVPLDDLRTAPDGLAPGDTVTALVRPGDALLPEQLRRSLFFLPTLFAAVGCLFTAVGFLALRADPPTGPTDPESWL